ncbi:TPA: DUF3883 domain-containing protein [Legionella pneumophila]|nr:DUF3883 domain-containing protein [Legionella pneumophila]
MIYETPSNYYFRIHHVRPRFKNNVEQVILYIADAICYPEFSNKNEFTKYLIEQIYKFPGNATKKLKTIQNWRTEISALFGLYSDSLSEVYISPLAVDLSENQDLTKFFKYFLYTFQYPGGHIKPHEIQRQLENGVLFNPARYFLKVIKELANFQKSEAYLTKGEACHMIFNDLRAIQDYEMKNVESIANRIHLNRLNKIEYVLKGDTIRYAGDILDYMVLANLVKNYAGKFYINSSESKTITHFINNRDYFVYEDGLNLYEIGKREIDWVQYTASFVQEKLFETDVLAFIASDEKEYEKLQERTKYIQHAEIPSQGTRTKEIGDYGESLVYGHECMFLKLHDREDLIHWVQCIPNHFAVGYDIQSVDINEIKKFIEVKSTISKNKLTFNRFKLTKSELSSAQTMGENYYIYRLQITNVDNKPVVYLSVIRNPLALFKKDMIDIDLSTGEINLKSYTGEAVELLKWKANS